MDSFSTNEITDTTIFEVLNHCSFKQNDSKLIEEVLSLVETDPNWLVFGKDVVNADLQFELKKIIVHHDYQFQTQKPNAEMHITFSTKLREYQLIGIRWFPLNSGSTRDHR